VITWPYIAGFFDGEGSVCVPMGTDRTSLRVTLCQSLLRGRVLLEEIGNFVRTEVGAIPKLRQETRRTGWREFWVLRFGGGNAANAEVLKRMMPHLHIKKVEAQDAIRHLIIYPNLRGSAHALVIKEGQARSPNMHGRKPTRPRTMVPLVCAGCGLDFSRPLEKASKRRKDGSKRPFCTYECYRTSPRTQAHNTAISRGLVAAYKEGKR